jgi:hypothetical protein
MPVVSHGDERAAHPERIQREEGDGWGDVTLTRV